MRIGVLTLPLHTNYGGILQAYALQAVLERMGHEVCLIEKERKPLRVPLWKAPLTYSKRILKNLFGSPVPVFFEQKLNREGLLIRQNTDCFIHKYIKRYIVEDFPDLKEDDFDAIVVGSDQIWRTKYMLQIEHAYLDFAEGWDIRRIVYAASFGTDEWEYTPEQTKECNRLLKFFDAVSVREMSGVDLCYKYFGVKAVHVLDPTMLLPAEDYIRQFEIAGVPESPGTLLCYILDESPEKTALINCIADEKGLVPFRVNSKVDDASAPLEARIQPPVEQWLRGFYDAKFVVTDSFHACVFSILFNKPFIAYGNAKRGMSRFKSLLNGFGLQNRLILSLQEYVGLGDIDWGKIHSALDNERIFAKNFLSDNLNWMS